MPGLCNNPYIFFSAPHKGAEQKNKQMVLTVNEISGVRWYSVEWRGLVAWDVTAKGAVLKILDLYQAITN